MKAAMRAVKNSVMAFDEIEIKVREATSSDRWGVTDAQMHEIARATNDYEQYPKLFGMVWKRLTDVEHVMHVQKALLLVEFLLRYGSDRFVQDARRRSRDIAALVKYKHYDENNQDDAKEARAKAKTVNELLSDERRLAEERTKAAKIKENTRGIGSNDYAHNQDRGDDRYGGQSGGGNSRAQAEYDNPYDGERERERAPAPRQRREEPAEEDPYASAPRAKASAPAPAAAPALTEEEEAAERKRKKKEKKRREEAAAAAAAAAASGGAAAQDDDPFSSSVIPSTIGGEAAPAGEEKKEKKKKKDKAAAAAAAPAATSAAAQYAAMAAPKQSAPPSVSSADVDLSSFADNGQRSVRGGGGGSAGGDFDFLSGSGAAGGDDLTGMFSNASLDSQPTLWDSHASHANGNNGHGPSSLSFDDDATPSSSAPAGPKKDTWSSDLFNLERLDQAPAQPKKGVVEGGVSMSMMKNLNPNSVATPKRPQADPMALNNNRGGSMGAGFPGGFGGPPQQQGQQPGFGGPQQGGGGYGGNPAFAHTGGFASSGGYQAPPPSLGPQMGYGGGGYGGPQGMMGGGGMGMGMGMGGGGMQPGMQGGYGGMQGGGMQGGYGMQQRGPQMGGGGGYGNAGFGQQQPQQSQQPDFFVPQQKAQGGGGMMGGGAPNRGGGNNAMNSLDPFASLGVHKTTGTPDFFVPAARK